MTVTRRISKIIKDGIEYNIVGGGSEAVDTCLDTTSENPVQNKVIAQAINGKQDALTAGANVTIATNQQTGNLEISATDTTYSNATETSDGLMSASDKKKLDKFNGYVDVLILGGGGAGGHGRNSNNHGGGGGAGELKIIDMLPVNYTNTCVVVGAGGGTSMTYGLSGCESKFGNIFAEGGGGGGGGYCEGNCIGRDGASGGGAGGGHPCSCAYPTFGGLGSKGGNGGLGKSKEAYGYGGGGGGVGGDAGYGLTLCGWNNAYQCSTSQYNGGPGVITCFGGVNICVGGGGSGGGLDTCNKYTGLFYGGGRGGTSNSGSATGCCGKANTGSGGGGGYNNNSGGVGGSGLVIVRYPADGSYGITNAEGGTKSSSTINGVTYCVHRFTSNGTFIITG